MALLRLATGALHDVEADPRMRICLDENSLIVLVARDDLDLFIASVKDIIEEHIVEVPAEGAA
jgi:hypothetical protein